MERQRYSGQGQRLPRHDDFEDGLDAYTRRWVTEPLRRPIAFDLDLTSEIIDQLAAVSIEDLPVGDDRSAGRVRNFLNDQGIQDVGTLVGSSWISLLDARGAYWRFGVKSAQKLRKAIQEIADSLQ